MTHRASWWTRPLGLCLNETSVPVSPKSDLQRRDPLPDTTGSMPARSCLTIGRYVVYRELAYGGMATILLGELRGEAGFSRVVALKRLHPQYANDPEFVSMFTDE